MSYITTSGYGYSKRLCKDITCWFLNKFLPRHKIAIDIIHRGLKREEAFGYCDVVGETYRPRHFLIELDTYMDKEMYIKTLLHELTHLRQWVEGTLRSRYGKMYYGKECVEDIEYWYKPHEVEARYMEEELYQEYLEDKNLVPLDKVVQYFPNRLISIL